MFRANIYPVSKWWYCGWKDGFQYFWGQFTKLFTDENAVTNAGNCHSHDIVQGNWLELRWRPNKIIKGRFDLLPHGTNMTLDALGEVCPDDWDMIRSVRDTVSHGEGNLLLLPTLKPLNLSPWEIKGRENHIHHWRHLGRTRRYREP